MISQKGFSMQKLEREAGLHRNFISNLLQGKSKNPGIDSIIKIASALNVSIDKLIGKELAYKSYNLNINRKDIFFEVVNYLSNATPKKSNNILKLDDFFNAIHEIYRFSLKKNCFDKEFADWFIDSHL